MTKTDNLKIASWNLKGLNHVIKKKKILTYLKSSKVDIAFVQETHLTKKSFIETLDAPGWETFSPAQ